MTTLNSLTAQALTTTGAGEIPAPLLIILALLPAVTLGVVVYRHDRNEPEPIGLLLKLAGLGALSGLAAVIIELAGSVVSLLASLLLGTIGYIVVDNLIVGLAEEGVKLAIVKRYGFNDSNFSHTFDGIVYAACVTLGFAAFENVFYVLDGGVETAITRALVAVPGHLCYGIIMGMYVSRAKAASAQGDHEGYKSALKNALLLPALLHAADDALLDFVGIVDVDLIDFLLIMMWICLVLAEYVLGFVILRSESKRDAPIVFAETPSEQGVPQAQQTLSSAVEERPTPPQTQQTQAPAPSAQEPQAQQAPPVQKQQTPPPPPMA